MIDGDKEKLEKIISNKLSYGHSNGLTDDKREFIEKIVSGRSDFTTIDISEQTITISGKVAVVRHMLKAETNDNGKRGDVQLKVLLIWQKKREAGNC